MSIFQSLLEAYVAPEMEAKKALEYTQQAPQRTADAWASIMEQVKPKPDVAGSMYSKEDVAGNDVLSALTQSAPAQQAHQQLTPKQSSAERLQAQLDLMVRSGDPTLQKRAMELFGTTPAAGKMSASARIAIDIGLRPGTPEFNQFVQSHAMKSGTTVNMGGKAGYLTDQEKKEGGLDPDSPFVWGKNGVPTPVKTSAFTEGNLLAAGFAERMYEAEKEIESLMTSGFDPTTGQQKIGEVIPYIGGHMQTEDQQVATRAQRDWVRAKLRKESGAVIAQEEMESEIETYFPQPGDHPKVIKAKKAARTRANAAMSTASGGKYTSESAAEKQAKEDKAKIDKVKKETSGDNSERVWAEGDGPAPGIFWAKE
jgi:hypothetical protein